MSETLWTPSNARIEKSRLRQYLTWLQTREGRSFTDHDALWLVIGTPPEGANTLEMTPAQLAELYPDGPKALPPELT